MSKIGNTPITIVAGVSIELTPGMITVRGPEGVLTVAITPKLKVEQVENVLNVVRLSNDKKTRSMHGLTRKLIANAVEGVTKRFEKKLEVVGTGYNVKMQGEGMVFKLGYSHLIEMKKPEGIRFAVEGNNITVSGIDKQLVGEVSNKIYTLKKPDPYKGKGLRYAGQVVKLKPGKKAKA